MPDGIKITTSTPALQNPQENPDVGNLLYLCFFPMLDFIRSLEGQVKSYAYAMKANSEGVDNLYAYIDQMKLPTIPSSRGLQQSQILRFEEAYNIALAAKDSLQKEAAIGSSQGTVVRAGAVTSVNAMQTLSSSVAAVLGVIGIIMDMEARVNPGFNSQ